MYNPHIKIINFKFVYSPDTVIILYCILLKYTFNTHPLVFNPHIKIIHFNFLFKIIPFTYFLNLCTPVSCVYYKSMKYSFQTVWYNIVAYYFNTLSTIFKEYINISLPYFFHTNKIPARQYCLSLLDTITILAFKYAIYL